MNIRSSHKKAMELVKNANLQFEQGEFDKYNELIEQAFYLEKESAEFLKEKIDVEPTRSVLYRSAANLAFSLKRYEDAYLLAFEGLNGKPFPEIKGELNNLLQSISNQFITSKQSSLYNVDYLNSLRDKAVALKLEEKSGRYGGAIVVSHILDFLKNLQSSYQNFAEVQFRKIVSEDDVPDLDYISTKFRNNCNLLVPDLNFKSFGVSIVADHGVMDPFDFHTEDFRVMRSNLFMNFKEDVLLPEYNDSSYHQRIAKKYTEEERRKIFTPVINSTLKSKPYSVAVTGKNYIEKVKIFQPLSNTSKSILKPNIEKTQVKEDLQLIKKIEQNIGSKKKTISIENITYYESEINLSNVSFGDKSVFLNIEHIILLTFENKYFTVNDEFFGVNITADEYFETLKLYDQEFISLYVDLLNRKSDLTSDEMELLQRFEENSMRNW